MGRKVRCASCRIYYNADMFDEPGYEIKERFYQSTFKPHLKHEMAGENYYYFLDQSWNAWRLGVKKNDIKNMLFVEWLCQELNKDNPEDFPRLISYLLDQVHDAIERISQSEKEYFKATHADNTDIIEWFSGSLSHYKTFFESEFRLWSTIPYYFAVQKYGKRTGASTPDALVEIPAGSKLQAIKDIKVVIPEGYLKDLTEGFDNTIRNAGEGHDRYEISDNNTVILHDIDPNTGKPKGKKEIELTRVDISNLIQLCRKTVWILKNGIMLYIANNPDFTKKLNKLRPMKIREIEARINSYADTRWLKVKKFALDKEKNILKFELAYYQKRAGISTELLFGNGERYDLVDIDTNVKYKHQVWGILQYLLKIWSREPYPIIDLKLSDNKDKVLSDLTYTSEELKKLLEGKKTYEPVSSKGIMTEGEYTMTGAIRVPYGTRDIAIKMAEGMGYKVRKL